MLVPTAMEPGLEQQRREPGTDEEVVSRVLRGETDLYEVLMRRNNQRLYRAARAILKDDTDVEDVMQEAYVSAFSHLADFKNEARFSTWLTRIAVHEAFGRLRRRKRFEPIDDAAPQNEEVAMTQLPRSDRNPEERASDREIGAAIEEAIDTLPEGFRTVFVLRAVEEMSVAETALCLEIPEDTVKTRLHRARGLLQKALVDRIESSASRAFEFHLSRCDRVVAGVMGRIARSE